MDGGSFVQDLILMCVGSIAAAAGSTYVAAKLMAQRIEWIEDRVEKLEEIHPRQSGLVPFPGSHHR